MLQFTILSFIYITQGIMVQMLKWRDNLRHSGIYLSIYLSAAIVALFNDVVRLHTLHGFSLKVHSKLTNMNFK